MSGRPAIFLDRDGTLNEEMGYLNHLSRFQIYPWTPEAIRLINRSGFLAVVVTNQSGVARGYFDEELVHEVHGFLKKILEESGARLDGIYYCPHYPEGTGNSYRRPCDCRKPKPGMMLRAESELGVDLRRSYIISDQYRDLEMGWSVGARAVLVLTGYGRGNYEHLRGSWPRQPDRVAENVFSAVAEIVEEAGR